MITTETVIDELIELKHGYENLSLGVLKSQNEHQELIIIIHGLTVICSIDLTGETAKMIDCSKGYTNEWESEYLTIVEQYLKHHFVKFNRL